MQRWRRERCSAAKGEGAQRACFMRTSGAVYVMVPTMCCRWKPPVGVPRATHVPSLGLPSASSALRAAAPQEAD